MSQEYEYRMAKEGQKIYDDCLSPAANAAKQVGGTHYNKHNIQPWNIIDEYKLDYYKGNAIKYILRDKTNNIEDIEKAIHYLEYWLELHPNA